MELDPKKLEEIQSKAWRLFQGKHNDHASVSLSMSGGNLYLFFILAAEGGTISIYANFPDSIEEVDFIVSMTGSQIDREVLMSKGKYKVQRFYNEDFNKAARKRRDVTIMFLEDLGNENKVVPISVMPHLCISANSDLLSDLPDLPDDAASTATNPVESEELMGSNA